MDEPRTFSIHNETGLAKSDFGTLVNEANSDKYSLSTNMVRQLSTGHWAIFNRKYELTAIVTEFARLEMYVTTCEPYRVVSKTKAKPGAKITDINLEDLGL